MRVVETAILSTDLAMYFKKKSKFLELVDNGEFDWQSPEKKECKRNKHISLFFILSIAILHLKITFHFGSSYIRF